MKHEKSYSESIASELIKLLKRGTAPWQVRWKPGEAASLPYNQVTKKTYKGINSLVLMMVQSEKEYDDDRWLTFKQAQSIDCSVKKGEKGTGIIYWKVFDERQMRDSEGRPILDSEGNPIVEKILLERPRLFFSSVFNARQINGLEVVEKLPVWTDLDRAKDILESSHATIIHSERKGAYYRISSDTITLPSKDRFDNASNYYSVALHELGHWTGHPSRLNRDLSHPYGSLEYAKEELRAEIASMMLGRELGIGFDPSGHAGYVESWIKLLDNDPNEIFRASSDAEKIQKYLFQLTQQNINSQNQAPEIRDDSVYIRREFTDIATVTLNNIELTEKITENYKKVMKDRILLTAEKLKNFREGYCNDSEFESYAREQLDVPLNPHLNAVKLQHNKITSVTDENTSPYDQEEYVDEKSLSETWNVFIQVNNQDLWLKEFSDFSEAKLFSDGLKLIDALAREDEYDKNVRIKRIIEEQTLSNPNASQDEIRLAAYNREEAERVATLHNEAVREQVMNNTQQKENKASMSSDSGSLTDSAQSMAMSNAKLYLVVPFEQKEEAKLAGVRWDREAKSWYVLQSKVNRQKIDKWLPKNTINQVSINTPQEQFTQFLVSMGAVVSGQGIIMDGKKRRIAVADDKGNKKSGVYFGFLDGIPAGYFKDFRSGIAERWKIDKHELNNEQIKRLREQAEHNLRKRKEESDLAFQRAIEAFKSLLPYTLAALDVGHPYLTDKNARAGDLRIVDDVLDENLNPMIKIAQNNQEAVRLKKQFPDDIILTKGQLLLTVQDVDNNLLGFQVIRDDGVKLLTNNTRKENNFHIVGSSSRGIDVLNDSKAIVIAEGYSTADTISQAVGFPVVMAFDAGNLVPVAKTLKERFPEKIFVIAGDDDFQLELKQKSNPGKTKAIEAAKAVNGAFVLPTFAPNEQRPDNVVHDFNDLANKSVLGITAVRNQVMAAIEAEKIRIHSDEDSLSKKQIRLTQAIKMFR